MFKATARRFSLAPPVITNGVSNMIREVCFVKQDYAYLKVKASAFLFIAQMSAAAKKL